jgi:hypothetical protein
MEIAEPTYQDTTQVPHQNLATGLAKARLCLRSRHGSGELLSILIATPMVLIIIGMLMYFGRVQYVRAALEASGVAGARFAATSLSGAKGCDQAREAIRLTLAGYHLDPDAASFEVKPVTSWGRGRRARITLGYGIRQANAPIFGPLMGDSQVKTSYEVTIDAFNNRYSNGWQACVQPKKKAT